MTLDYASDLTTPFVPTIAHERMGFVRCGTMGHSWFDYDSNWTTRMGTPLTLRCERCGTERRDVIGTYGNLVSRSYAYPDHYRYPKGERPTRDEFRVLLLMQRMQEARSKRR
jgi:hypothetical protein